MTLNIVHCHSTFDLGGKEARAVMLMNAFGRSARHTILSSVPGAFGARAAINDAITVNFPNNAPALAGRPSMTRYRNIAEYLRHFDLILTYNWGAMDAVVARRIHRRDLPPLVHHEDGFNADESAGLKSERTCLRRIAFPGAHAVAVPSRTLEEIAVKTWRQRPEKVRRIANGIAITDFGKKARSNAIPGLRRQKGEVIIGTVAGLRPVKNLSRLVRAALSIPATRLVIVGDGPERDRLIAAASALGVRERLILPGFLAHPQNYLGLFDIFAVSSDSEQAPIALIEAMAAGLPVAATDVGDVAAMVPAVQRPFVTARDDHALAGALRQLVADPALRALLGQGNQARARDVYDARTTIAAYAALYNEALGERGTIFTADAL